MASLGERFMAAYDAFKNPGREPVIQQAGRYATLYSWWVGSWRNDVVIAAQRRTQPTLYRNTRQVWSDARELVSFYAKYVYPGPLSRDGKALQDGTRGAIPIDPQAGSDDDNEALVRAISEIFVIGNWSQLKSFRPKMGAILGDYLVELVDDMDRGLVLPSPIWPGHVTDLELDLSGNVKRYAIEQVVTIPQSKAFGGTTGETYRFRKEVDGKAFRLFKDDKPHAYPELGFPAAEIENPYGFVPAIWDRHEIVPGDRGLSALDTGLSQELEINSILSHALDYQQKQFAAPVGVIGRTRKNRNITLPGGITVGTAATAEDIEEARRATAENVNILDLEEGGQFVTVQFDVGKTTQMLQMAIDARKAEHPEARFGQEILQMTQLTGPGIKRGLGPVVGLMELAQANYDPQTIKAAQMGIAIMGYRLQQRDYPDAVVQGRPDRYAAFEPFDLTSYGEGKLDFSIGPRDPFPETPEERVQRLILLGSVIDSGDPWLIAQAGVPEEEVTRIIADQEKRRREQEAAFSVAGAGSGQQNQQRQGEEQE